MRRHSSAKAGAVTALPVPAFSGQMLPQWMMYTTARSSSVRCTKLMAETARS